jgi:hypothetical protein
LTQERKLKHLKAVKASHEADLMRKANVVGVGIGFRQRAGKLTDEPAIVVSVTHKVPASRLSPSEKIPHELEGVPVDVQAVGTLRALR